MWGFVFNGERFFDGREVVDFWKEKQETLTERNQGDV